MMKNVTEMYVWQIMCEWMETYVHVLVKITRTDYIINNKVWRSTKWA